MKMREVRGAELTIVIEQTWNLTTPLLAVLALYWPVQMKAILKVVKKMSKFKVFENLSKTLSSGNSVKLIHAVLIIL